MAEGFDESLLDPRLCPGVSSGSAHTQISPSASPSAAPSVSQPLPGFDTSPGSAPATGLPGPLLEGMRYGNLDSYDPDENRTLPASASQSLDFLLASNDVQNPNERFWLIGLQAGIGLGIFGAREAVLNEMQNENTVFGRAIQSSSSDPDPLTMRYRLGQACQEGFDRRVAYRSANRYIEHSFDFVKWVVDNGRTDLLPDTGGHLFGTSAFFCDEDVALCHYNAWQFQNTPGRPAMNASSELEAGNNAGGGQTAPPAPMMESFLGYGRYVAGIDMTQLDASVAHTMRAVYAAYDIGPVSGRAVQHVAEPSRDAHEAVQNAAAPSGDAHEAMQEGTRPSEDARTSGALENHGQNTEGEHGATDDINKESEAKKPAQNARRRNRKPTPRSTNMLPVKRTLRSTTRQASERNINGGGDLTHSSKEEEKEDGEEEQERSQSPPSLVAAVKKRRRTRKN